MFNYTHTHTYNNIIKIIKSILPELNKKLKTAEHRKEMISLFFLFNILSNIFSYSIVNRFNKQNLFMQIISVSFFPHKFKEHTNDKVMLII